MNKLSVLITDDHPIVLMGIRGMVESTSQFEVAGTAHSATELIEMLTRMQQSSALPPIVVTDYNMPGDETHGDGIKLIGYLLRRFASVKLLIYTMVSNPLIIASLYDLGVAGVVQKTQPLTELRKALECVAGGRIYRPGLRATPDAADKISSKVERLSAREFEVLRHFVAGMSMGEIAKMLNRSVKTISAQKWPAWASWAPGPTRNWWPCAWSLACSNKAR